MTPEDWQRVRPILESALELDSSSRAAFLEGACANSFLRREVESLIASHEQAHTYALEPGSRLASRHLDEAQFRLSAGKRIGPYEVLAEIAVGGMGAVYRAIRADGQYRQQVALKIVRSELGAEYTATRFRNERQILASLDHPNIAKILDGGTTADGLPYFVMEFIDGLPITEYCDQHKLSVDERLKIFRAVCSAVHYAHQHLVIHRDIKPGNILVTSEGVPKLLDFGIAKILDPTLLPESAAVTQTGLWVMTPEYASPEQLRGEAITTAVDLYSLGLILYELLTGHRVYRLASLLPHEIARAILETDPEKPSIAVERKDDIPEQGKEKSPLTPEIISSLRADSPEKLSQRISGDLDNVVLKAIRKEPRERYNSVDQFSEDIRRHLEHLPVLARDSTVAYRCRKYILRHKVGVSAAALVLLSLLTGIVLTLREARIATAQSTKAERRFQDVRALANSLMFDVYDSIQDLPGATPARKIIVEKALQYLDGLAGESQGDPSLQRELAAAYKRIGDVQGYVFNANLGDTTAALGSYEKALAIRKSLWSSEAGNVEDALALAEAFRLVSQTQMEANDLSAALENAQKTVELVEPLRKSDSNDAAVLLEFIVDCQAVANIESNVELSSLGNNAIATVFRRKQLDAAEQLASLDPGGDRGEGNLAIALTSLGDQLWQGGERAAPMQYYSRARTIFNRIAQHSERKRARATYLLNLVRASIAYAELANGELDKALATARETTGSIEKLSQEDPSDAQSAKSVADDYVMLADLESRSGRAQASSADINKAAKLITRLVGPGPKDMTGLNTLTGLYLAQGALASRSRDGIGALKSYDAAIAVFSQLQSSSGNNAGAREHLAATYNMVGRVQMKQKNFEAAAVSFNRARALSNLEWAVGNANAQEPYTIADADTGLGDIEATLGADARKDRKSRADHWQQAVSWYERSLATWGAVKEPGLVSPDMFDAVPPSLVARQLALAKVALSGLTVVQETPGVVTHRR